MSVEDELNTARKALHCLRLDVPPKVVEDIRAICEKVFKRVELGSVTDKQIDAIPFMYYGNKDPDLRDGLRAFARKVLSAAQNDDIPS